jgi:hypothetical protein
LLKDPLILIIIAHHLYVDFLGMTDVCVGRASELGDEGLFVKAVDAKEVKEFVIEAGLA